MVLTQVLVKLLCGPEVAPHLVQMWHICRTYTGTSVGTYVSPLIYPRAHKYNKVGLNLGKTGRPNTKGLLWAFKELKGHQLMS